MATERPNTVAGLIEERREISDQIEHHLRILNDLVIAGGQVISQ